MSKLFAIFKGTLRRSRVMLVLSVATGLVLCFLFSVLTGLQDAYYGPLSVGFVDGDNTPASQDFARYLAEGLGMTLLEGETEHLETQLLEKHISAIVTLPAGYEEGLLAGGTDLVQVTCMDDYANAAFVRGYLQSYTATAAMLGAAADGSAGTLAALLSETAAQSVPISLQTADPTLQQASVEAEGFDYTIGFFLMLSFLLAIGLANMLFTDRTGGMYSRVKASSVGPVPYVLGVCLCGLVASLAMVLIFFLYAGFTGYSTGVSLPLAALVALAYSMVIVAVALAASLYLPSRNAIMAFITSVSTVTCMLGGAYFPLDMVPEGIRSFSRATPQYWVMQAIYSLRAGESIALNLVVLGLFAALFFLLAGIRFADSGARARAA